MLKALETSATVGLAAFAIWVLNRVWKDRWCDLKRHADQIQQLYEETRDVVRNNTEAITRLIERLK